MERLIFGLISLLGLGIMIVGGTMQSSFIAGAMFFGGMAVFMIFVEEAVSPKVTLHQIAEEERRCQISQK